MDTSLNVALLVTALLASVVALGGETWNKEVRPWWRRLTRWGYLALALVATAFTLGIVKEAMDARDRDAAQKRETELQQSATEANRQLKESTDRIKELESTLADVRRLSEGVTRTVDSEGVQILPESRRVQTNLNVRPGDVLEWYCPDDPRSMRITIVAGERRYPLQGSRGDVRIFGRIGESYSVVLEIKRPGGTFLNPGSTFLKFTHRTDSSEQALQRIRELYSGESRTTPMREDLPARK